LRNVILLSGKKFTGKTELAEELNKQFGYKVFSSKKHIAQIFNLPDSAKPSEYITKGQQLNIQSDHKWLFDAVKAEANTTNLNYVIDNICTPKQLQYFRKERDWNITHVHLYCPSATHETRLVNSTKYDKNITYHEINYLDDQDDIVFFMNDADIRINTDRTDNNDNLVRVAAGLKLYPAPDTKLVDVIIGGQYGSEGKGNIAAYLAQEYDIIIRVGGPNAGHTVSSESGVTTYYQLPSGSKDTKAEILLGPGMTIDADKLLKEIEECNISSDRLFIDPQCMLINESDCTDETSLVNGIGSTGRGSGAAAARRIMQRNTTTRLAKDDDRLKEFVGCSHPYRGSTYLRLEKAFLAGKSILLEGTQGSGLSLYHGQYPYVTSRDTNVAGCLAEAGISPSRVRKILLVTRYTPIRVANPEGDTSGPLKHEVSFDEISLQANLSAEEVKTHEHTSVTKKLRRASWFDWELFRKSASLNAPTDIVLTFADYIDKKNENARRFEQLTEDTIKFVEEIERVAQAPVSIISTRFPRNEDTYDLRNIIDRRNWSCSQS
jgi:adenylosuccinate synthase